MAFTARTTAPSYSNKYYLHTSYGGVNECILISKGSCLPNCVGYAWGRAYEVLKKRPALSRRNAEDWYGYTSDGYSRGKTAKAGAIACWSKGKVGVDSDGAGHVAFVEKVNSDGSFVTSNSGYNSTRFFMRTLPKSGALSGYKFQGFIYLPVKISVSKPKYSVGKNYKTQVPLYVRKTASTSGTKMKIRNVTADCRKNAVYKSKNANVILKSGTTVTCKEVKTDKSGNIWLKIPSGYICGYYKKTIYVK